MSPSANTSGRPGSVRSRLDGDRARRCRRSAPASSPSCGEPRGADAGGPDHGPLPARAAVRRRAALVERHAVAVDARPPSVLSTASRRACRATRVAFADSDGGNVVRIRSAGSTSRMRASRGSIDAGSRGAACRGRARRSGPAISTPVGPPPTTTKVSHAARGSGSGSASARLERRQHPAADERARSRATSPRPRCSRHSSWPKYE